MRHVHFLPLIVAKLRKLIEQDLLEHVLFPLGGSKLASPIVVLRKLYGDKRIGGEFKISVNH